MDHKHTVAFCCVIAALVVSCGGSPASTTERSTADEAESSSGGEAFSAADICAALQGAIAEHEAEALRTLASAQADRTGASVEEVLAEWADEAESEEPIWSCPATDLGHHRPQESFAPLALSGGASARIIPVVRESSEGEFDRFVYLAVSVPGQPPRLEWIGESSDPNGEEWSQIVVTAFDGGGPSLTIVAEGLNCVPAGSSDELQDEPPACTAHSRYDITCTLVESAMTCEHQTEELE